jgi:hypothetical protein
VEEVRALSAWVDPTDDPMREVARRGAGRMIREARYRTDWAEVSEGLKAWAGRSRDFLPWPDRWFPVPEWFDIDAMPFRVKALPHLLDAAAALLVAEQLHPDEVDALLWPWRDVMARDV